MDEKRKIDKKYNNRKSKKTFYINISPYGIIDSSQIFNLGVWIYSFLLELCLKNILFPNWFNIEIVATVYLF